MGIISFLLGLVFRPLAYLSIIIASLLLFSSIAMYTIPDKLEDIQKELPNVIGNITKDIAQGMEGMPSIDTEKFQQMLIYCAQDGVTVEQPEMKLVCDQINLGNIENPEELENYFYGMQFGNVGDDVFGDLDKEINKFIRYKNTALIGAIGFFILSYIFFLIVYRDLIRALGIFSGTVALIYFLGLIPIGIIYFAMPWVIENLLPGLISGIGSGLPVDAQFLDAQAKLLPPMIGWFKELVFPFLLTTLGVFAIAEIVWLVVSAMEHEAKENQRKRRLGKSSN